MRIASLQFAPKLGEVEENTVKADKLLGSAITQDIDLLVLPEMAFSGYNFSSFEEIKPFLEPTASGASTLWARKTAARLNCLVSIGYPEISAEKFEMSPLDQSVESPASKTNIVAISEAAIDTATLLTSKVPASNNQTGFFKCYNAAVTVDPKGFVVSHYRKTFLYYTDVTWAQEGPGFGFDNLFSFDTHDLEEGHRMTDVPTAQGICMDINPHAFSASWTAYEFAQHVMSKQAKLAILNMAWLLPERGEAVAGKGEYLRPSMSTMGYWLERLVPLIQQPKDVVVICANRCGTERNATYAGSSAVMVLGNGRAALFGVLGQGEEGLLKVDTSVEPKYKFNFQLVGSDESNADG